MKILLVNGNTNDAVTGKMARTAEAAASPGTTVVPVTATFGARIISSRCAAPAKTIGEAAPDARS